MQGVLYFYMHLNGLVIKQPLKAVPPLLTYNVYIIL